MKTLKQRFTAVFTSVALSLAVAGAAATQGDSSPSSPPGVVYSNHTLRFRYRPVGGMRDETESRKAEIQSRAASLRTNKTLDLLLAMSSGKDDTAPEWHSLSIEAYPRKAFSHLDDVSAKARMTAWVAGIGGLLGTPRSAVLSGQSFAVYVVGERDGTLRKGAVIWTTIVRGKLLSFAFVSNSPKQLTILTGSMKTVRFF